MFAKARKGISLCSVILAKADYFSFLSFHVEGSAGIFGFADLADFWFGVLVFAP